jgi:hypothetical protein
MRTKIRPFTLNASRRLFHLVMPMYPAVLRREFGADMAEVFDQKTQDEWERHGLAGVARLWVGIPADVVQSLRIPEIEWRLIFVPIFSVAGSFALFVLFFVTSHLAAHCVK